MNTVSLVERELGRLCCSTAPVLTRSGSEGFFCSLLALELSPDAEVVLPVSICQTMVNAVLMAGAIPILADVDAHLALCAEDLRRRLSARTRVVVAHHPHGHAMSLAPIREAIDAYAPASILVEDCAQSLGAVRHGRPVGSSGDLLVLSFAAGKPLSAGFGGAIGARDPVLLEQIRRACRVGAMGFTDHTTLGLNSCLTEVEAGVVLGELRRLPEALAERTRRARLCFDRIAGHAAIVGQAPIESRGENIFHRVLVVLPTDSDPARYHSLVARIFRELEHSERVCVETALAVPTFAARVLVEAYKRRRPDLLDSEGSSFVGWRRTADRYVGLRTHDGISDAALVRACDAILRSIKEHPAS